MKALFGTFVLMISLSTFASHPEIVCETPRGSQQMVLKNTAVSIFESVNNSDRAIASEYNVRTNWQGSGFNKVIFKNGNKHTIHIQDVKNFSEVEDYIIIKNRNGHEVTYPLTCALKR